MTKVTTSKTNRLHTQEFKSAAESVAKKSIKAMEIAGEYPEDGFFESSNRGDFFESIMSAHSGLSRNGGDSVLDMHDFGH